jgi:hypothetical protein
MNTKILTPTDHAILAIKRAPRVRGTCIHWAADISVPAMVALAILSANSQVSAIDQIVAESGASITVLKNLARGNKADGQVWPELRERLTAADIKWNENARGAARRMAISPPADITAPAAFTAMRTQPIDVPPPPVTPKTATMDEHIMDAARVSIKPAATLAVKANGEVTITAPPVAAVAPSPMIAAAGGYASKECATRYVLDTKDNDILAITTKRIAFGTPEWCAKMVEINKKPKT